MSRIYDDKPLENLPLHQVSVDGGWDTTDYTKGNGILLEGVIKLKARLCIMDKNHKKVNYYILFLDLNRAHRRTFDGKGKEIEPNFSETHKVRTGYLNSSYKTEAKGSTDRLQEEEVRNMTSKPVLNKAIQSVQSLAVSNTAKQGLSLWLPESKSTEAMEINIGDQVRIKTSGDGPFIYNIVRMEGDSVTHGNYTGGEPVGASWTDKIMDVKSSIGQQAVPSGQGDCAEEDEWDD